MAETEQINLRVPGELRDKIDQRAEKVGISRNAWLNRALEWALEQPVTERPRKERV